MLPLLPSKTYAQRYYEEHKDYFKELRKRKTPEQKRAEKLKHRYGMTVEQYDALLIKQNGVCYLCKRTNRGKRLYVDHNHHTNKIRGLLCNLCNFFMERVDADSTIIKRLEQYIEPSTSTV